MPTVEIVCLSAPGIPDLPRYRSFANDIELGTVSHRGLFQSDFDAASGPIAHLGNKSFEPDLDAGLIRRFWFASDLVAWTDHDVVIPTVDPMLGDEQWWGDGQADAFRFRPGVVPDVRDLLARLVAHSPTAGAYFTTDYQFGPEQPMRQTGYTTSRLFREHEETGLRWNCLYHVLPEHRAA